MLTTVITASVMQHFVYAWDCSKSFTCISRGRLTFKSQPRHSQAPCPRVSVVLLISKDTASDAVTLVQGLLHARDDPPQFTANLRVTSCH